MEAYGIFEGGGAKGYAHLGALKAAEDRGITFRAVAGTSAGAIIAALAAAGYRADELLDLSTDPPTGILHIDPLSILDPEEYRLTRALIDEAKALAGGEHRGWIAKRLGPRRLERLARSPWGPIGGQAYIAWRNRPALKRLFERFGLNDIERVATWLETLLRAKVTPPGGGPVLFRHLPIGLRVVAADLTRGQPRTFGGPSDQDVPVARAVAGSACFPLFFEPLRLGTEMLVDGGIVSNLPAWIFDDERDDDPRFLPTFGFRLVQAADKVTDEPVDAGESAPPDSPLDFAKRLFTTIQAGAPGLQERRIDDYYAIDLTTRISTLAFHELPARAAEVAREGRDCVRAFFLDAIGPQDPERMAELLRRMIRLLRDRYRWLDRVRASVLLPDRSGGAWARTTYSAGMERDGDDRMRIRLDRQVGVGAVFHRREPVYLRRDLAETSLGSVDRYELAGRPGDIRFAYAVPIFDDPAEWSRLAPGERSRPFAALVLDKEKAVDDLLNDPDEQDVLANLAAIVGEQVSAHAIVRTSHGDSKAPRSPAGSDAVDAAGSLLVSRRKARDVGDGDLSAAMGRAISDLDAGGWRRVSPVVPFAPGIGTPA